MSDAPAAAAPTRLPPALADVTGYLLRRAYVRALDVAAADLFAGGHPRRIAALIALEAAAAPTSQAFLAESLRVNRTLLGRLVEDLEADGLIERRRDPADRRAYALQPTAAGRRAVAEAAPAMARSDARLTAALSPAERDRLNALLRELLATDADRRVPAPLADRTGFLISQAHFLMRARGDAALREIGLEIRHYGALKVIEAGAPLSQQELARDLGVTPPVVVPVVDELEARGFVRRERNPADRRSYALRLTPDGERALRAARERLEGLTTGVFDEPRGEAGAELRALLRRLLGAEA